ncbi:MAG: HAD-IA family hydrolase [Thermoanaerobaculales bacterium]|nr:HAD-IA family hydrolase [Thermoanaerobaculales bacterium]
MSHFRLIIFDLDGTLVDSFPGIRLGLNLALDEFGRPPVDLAWVRRHVGLGARRLIAAAAGDGVGTDDLMARFRHHYDEVLCENSPPFPGTEEVLRELARNHTLAVASNKPIHWVEKLVAHHGWMPLMAAVEGPERAGAHKPDPSMVAKILATTGYDTTEAILVGDMPVDAETGRRAGVSVIGISTGAATAETLREAGCLKVLENISELPRLLERGFKHGKI